jgi:hypothetical protein
MPSPSPSSCQLARDAAVAATSLGNHTSGTLSRRPSARSTRSSCSSSSTRRASGRNSQPEEFMLTSRNSPYVPGRARACSCPQCCHNVATPGAESRGFERIPADDRECCKLLIGVMFCQTPTRSPYVSFRIRIPASPPTFALRIRERVTGGKPINSFSPTLASPTDLLGQPDSAEAINAVSGRGMR